MKWVLASDHAGVKLKAVLSSYLQEQGLSVNDKGAYSADEPCDYPDMADKACIAILSNKADMALLVCGTGIGVSMRANRYKGVRATLIHNEFTARAAKEHSNANAICFGERVVSEEMAIKCLKEFLNTEFAGGRHQKRLNKLDSPTNI